MTTGGATGVEGVALTTLVVGYVLWYLVRMLGRSRPAFRVGAPVAVGFGLRLAAIAGIGLTGLEATLRGGDETTFLSFARFLASQPIGRGYIPHGPFQLHTVLFAVEDRLGFMTVGAMRIVQVGIALTGVVLILAAVYDLAGSRAARIAAWIIALEPASIFFNSALHKEPNMELASGLVVFGGTMIWRKFEVRGLLLFMFGGLIAVWTRSYAGWFLVSAAALILLHAAIRRADRPLKAMPVVYGLVIAAFLVTPTLLAVSSKRNLQRLQQSQTANAQGIGQGSGGPNSDNLKLEQVDFSSRGAVLSNLPKRIRDLVLKPYPWQLADTNQRFGAVGTLVAYAIFALLVLYGWQSRGQIFPRAGPVLYPMLFMLVAYSLAAGNAGTGFRYRTHLVTLAIAAMVILHEQVVLVRERRRLLALEAVPVVAHAAPAEGGEAHQRPERRQPVPAPQPLPVLQAINIGPRPWTSAVARGTVPERSRVRGTRRGGGVVGAIARLLRRQLGASPEPSSQLRRFRIPDANG